MSALQYHLDDDSVARIVRAGDWPAFEAVLDETGAPRYAWEVSRGVNRALAYLAYNPWGMYRTEQDANENVAVSKEKIVTALERVRLRNNPTLSELFMPKMVLRPAHAYGHAELFHHVMQHCGNLPPEMAMRLLTDDSVERSPSMMEINGKAAADASAAVAAEAIACFDWRDADRGKPESSLPLLHDEAWRRDFLRAAAEQGVWLRTVYDMPPPVSGPTRGMALVASNPERGMSRQDHEGAFRCLTYPDGYHGLKLEDTMSLWVRLKDELTAQCHARLIPAAIDMAITAVEEMEVMAAEKGVWHWSYRRYEPGCADERMQIFKAVDVVSKGGVALPKPVLGRFHAFKERCLGDGEWRMSHYDELSALGFG